MARKKKPARRPVKQIEIKGPATSEVTIVAAPPGREVMTEKRIIDALDMLGITAKLTDERTKRLFIEVARQNNLNPLKREIHAVERKQKQADGSYKMVLTPVTGYEVFIDRAEESGRLHYWNVKSEGDAAAGTLKSTVTIKRRDWPAEFTWTVFYKEVRPAQIDYTVWQKEPHHMTEKVAISRAFRLCFRDILRGMPFTDEEMQTVDQSEEGRPEIKEPQEKAPSQETVDASTSLELARDKCQQLLKNMHLSKYYDTGKLAEFKEKVFTAKDDPAKLAEIYTAWSDMHEMETKSRGAQDA